MFLARRPRTARSLFVVVAAVLVGVGLPAVAKAEDPAPPSSSTITGELTRAWPEHHSPSAAADSGDDGPLTFVQTSAGDSVRVDSADVDELPTGATVQLTVGRAVADDASKDDGYEKVHDVLSAEVLTQPDTQPAPTSPAGTVNHSVSVVMVVPPGGSRDSTTLTDIVNMINGPVADFWSQQTDGAVNFGVTASRDWVSLNTPCTDPYTLWSRAAAAVGFTPGPDKHLVVYVSRTGAWCNDGLGTVGGSVHAGGSLFVRYAMPSMIAHELGHNLGLGHSSLEQCNASVNDPNCRTTSYYDLYDVMGASWNQMGSLNVAQASRLMTVSSQTMWINATPESPQDLTLAPVSGRTGVRGIRLTGRTGETYWLEYRPASGQDAWLGTSANQFGLQAGVLLRAQQDGSDTSLLLDGSPSPQSGWDPDLQTALPLNSTVRLTAAAGTFEITVTGMSASSATVHIVPKSAVTLAYEASGGSSGPMGSPTTTDQVCGTVTGSPVCQRSFAHGVVYWSSPHGDRAHLVYGGVFDAWNTGGGASTYGFPKDDTTCGLPDGGCHQHFDTGSIYWSSGTGAFAVSRLQDGYVAAGEESGSLGYPVGAEVCGLAGGGCKQDFQGGTLASSPATGTRLVRADIAAVWTAQRQEAGPLGYPTSGLICGLANGGCGQVFQGGRVYTTSGTGAHMVSGAIQDAWITQGWEAGALGYPTGDQTCGLAGGGCKQDFQGGTLYSSTSAGTHPVSGAVATAWQAAGAEGGGLGYPTSGLICGLKNAGCGQVFQGGRIYTTLSTGAHVVSGAIQDAWIAQGWETGPLGYAAGDQVCGLPDGGCKQDFQGGTLYSSTSAGTHPVSGAMATAWQAAGAESGTLGYPTSGLICGLKNAGCGQVFQGGRIYTTLSTGAHVVSGAVQTAWISQGWETGPLGYATGDQVCGLAGGACKQDFQGGTLYSTGSAVFPVSAALAATWQAAGAESGPLGAPTTGLICGLRNSGCGQVFQGGKIYSTPATGTHSLTGDVHDVWVAQGYEVGPLGYPTTDLICGMRASGCGQVFQGGRIYTSPGTGTHAVSGAIQSAWIAQGWEVGPLGYPTGDQVCTAAGCSQAYEGGSLYSTGAGTFQVTGDLAASWTAAGAQGGALGYPVSGLICGLKNGGCGQVFQGGRIYTTSGTGAHAVSGTIQNAWIRQGWEAGPLGYPTGDQVCGLAGGGCKQTFQGGTLYSLAAAGTNPVAGDLATAWTAAGAEAGALGYPTTGLICGLKNGGCGQVFQGGRIYSTAGTGTHAVSGAVQDAWIAQGWETGSLGYPTGDQVCALAGGGCKQDFQGGTIYSLPAAGTFPVTGDIATAWQAAGGEGGTLGYPTTGLICGLKDHGCGQVFQGGTIYRTTATGAHAVSGPIQSAWVAQGWETGPLGYPTSDPYAVANGTAQDFQGGRLTLDSGTGQVTRN